VKKLHCIDCSHPTIIVVILSR